MKFTSWFPVSVNPVHVGWYPVKAERYEWFCDNVTEACVKRTRRYWDGKKWMWMNGHRNMVTAAVFKADQWRGLAEKPK